MNRPPLLTTALLLAVLIPGLASAQIIHAGAWEVGAGFAWSNNNGDTRTDLNAHIATITPGFGRTLVSPELSVTYRHRSSLDALGMDLGLYTVYPFSDGPVSGHLGLAGGFLKEWVGSYSQTVYPVGANIGIRVLTSPSAALRLDYRVRRVLNDPVEEYWDQAWVAGISFLWNNRD